MQLRQGSSARGLASAGELKSTRLVSNNGSLKKAAGAKAGSRRHPSSSAAPCQATLASPPHKGAIPEQLQLSLA
jgi:hypothetical protein